MNNSNILSHLALLGATLCYGFNYNIAKDVMPDYIEPYGFIVVRIIGAGILFWVLSLIVKEKVEKKDYPVLILGGLFGVAINQMMFFKGLNLTTPINASIIMVSNPIIVLLVASIILKDKITSRKLIGVVLGAIGAVMLIAYGKKVSIDAPNTRIGNLLVLVNATSYGIYLIIMKPLMQKYHPFTIVKWVFLFGFFFVIPFGYEEFKAINWNTMPFDIYWRVAYVVVFTSFLAYLLNIFALKKLKPSTVSFYIYLQQVVTSIISISRGSDSLSALEIVSSLVIFYGVYLVSTKSKKLQNA